MPIKNDLSGLPKGDRRQGNLPDSYPRFTGPIAEAWFEKWKETSDLAFAVEGTRIRHSWAGKCAREISYRLTDTDETEPMDLASAWTVTIGHLVHDMWQEYLQLVFPEAQIEVKGVIQEIDSSCHVDAVVTFEIEGKPWKVALELKSINGFGFKMAIGARGEAEGPRGSAIKQGALNAVAMGADELVIAYVSLENLSPREAEKLGLKQPWQRFTAEWSFDKEQFTAIANDEKVRLASILAIVDDGRLAPRAIPDLPRGARITDPTSGTWTIVDEKGGITNAGTTWQCNYCSFQSRCNADLHGETAKA